MSSLISLIVLAVALLQSAESQKLKFGGCPKNVEVKPSFTLDSYLGSWHILATYGTKWFLKQGRCTTVVLSKDATNPAIINMVTSQEPPAKKLKKAAKVSSSSSSSDVKEAQKKVEKLKKKKFGDFTSILTIPNPATTDAKLRATYRVSLVRKVTVPYWVLDTDYYYWAVVYSCVDLGAFHFTSSFILSRDREPWQSVEDSISKALESSKTGLKRTMFTAVDQKRCPKDTPGVRPVQATPAGGEAEEPEVVAAVAAASVAAAATAPAESSESSSASDGAIPITFVSRPP